MQNYDEPYMIKYDDKNWRPADFRNGSFRHWDGPFHFNPVSSQPQVNEWTHLTSLPTSHPETDSMVKVEGLDPLVSTVKRASKSSESLPAPFMACQKSRDIP